MFGTCAGMIVLANEIAGGEPPILPLLDVTVERNAFGRQLESFEARSQSRKTVDRLHRVRHAREEVAPQSRQPFEIVDDALESLDEVSITLRRLSLSPPRFDD